MKKTSLLIFFAVLADGAFSQTEERAIVVGGNSNLSYISNSTTGSDIKTNSFNVGGGVGYFFMDDLSAGLSLSYTSISSGGASINTLGIGPVLRFYFDGTLFVEGGYILQSQNANAFNGAKANGGQMLIGAGYAVFLTDNIAFEPSVQYSIGTGDFDRTKNLALKFGFGLYF